MGSQLWSAPRKPGLARVSPMREEESRLAAEFFRQYWRDHRFSERDLMSILGCSKTVVHSKLSGRSPVAFFELVLIDRAHRGFLSACVAYVRCASSRCLDMQLASGHR